jgi:hypothetical protein
MVRYTIRENITLGFKTWKTTRIINVSTSRTRRIGSSLKLVTWKTGDRSLKARGLQVPMLTVQFGKIAHSESSKTHINSD